MGQLMTFTLVRVSGSRPGPFTHCCAAGLNGIVFMLFAGQVHVEYRPLRPMRDVSAYVSPPEPIPVAELYAKMAGGSNFECRRLRQPTVTFSCCAKA
jgi:hypothetical protein